MNILLAEAGDFIGEDQVVIRDRRFVHLRDVLHCGVGDVCRAGVLGGGRGTGKIEAMGADEALLRLTLTEMPPPELNCELILALPRPKTLKKVIHCAVSFGVKKLHFIQTAKVEKSYWDSPNLAPAALHEEMLLGLEQSGDTIPAEIEFHRLFRPFVEDELPSITARRNAAIIVAHPGAREKFHGIAPGSRAVLVLGPEGGFTEFEVGLLRSAGARTVNLGERILRTEFALAKILSFLD